MSQQCDMMAKNNNNECNGCIKGSTSSTLVRTVLEYCVQFEAQQFKKDVEHVQNGMTRMIKKSKNQA